MRPLIETMFAAQQELQLHQPGSARQRIIMDSLQKSVPAPILAHFLRLVGNRGRGVALVRHSVCSECHIRVPSSQVAALVKPKDIHVCDQCGCYLLLPAEEMPAAPAAAQPVPAQPAPRRRGRKCIRPLAA